MTTYAELTTQILNYTETSTDVLSSTITDDFIEHTENRILRECKRNTEEMKNMCHQVQAWVTQFLLLFENYSCGKDKMKSDGL